MLETEIDKRRSARADVHFITAYGRINSDTIVERDVTQTKNISEGGVLLTTSRPFEPSANLSLKINLPTFAEPVQMTGIVLESKQLHRNLVYLTRLEFIGIDEQKRKAIQQTVEYYSRRNRLQH
jgi:c-di-GMP-binding flagellar brake protein YcgR